MCDIEAQTTANKPHKKYNNNINDQDITTTHHYSKYSIKFLASIIAVFSAIAMIAIFCTSTFVSTAPSHARQVLSADVARFDFQAFFQEMRQGTAGCQVLSKAVETEYELLAFEKFGRREFEAYMVKNSIPIGGTYSALAIIHNHNHPSWRPKKTPINYIFVSVGSSTSQGFAVVNDKFQPLQFPTFGALTKNLDRQTKNVGTFVDEVEKQRDRIFGGIAANIPVILTGSIGYGVHTQFEDNGFDEHWLSFNGAQISRYGPKVVWDTDVFQRRQNEKEYVNKISEKAFTAAAAVSLLREKVSTTDIKMFVQVRGKKDPQNSWAQYLASQKQKAVADVGGGPSKHVWDVNGVDHKAITDDVNTLFAAACTASAGDPSGEAIKLAQHIKRMVEETVTGQTILLQDIFIAITGDLRNEYFKSGKDSQAEESNVFPTLTPAQLTREIAKAKAKYEHFMQERESLRESAASIAAELQAAVV